MPEWLASRATYANVVATVALFCAVGGSAYAAIALPANSVGTKQIRKGAVTSSKLARGVVIGGPRGATGLKGDPGPKGDLGPKGDQGPAGPSSGAAGGDLAGNYPAPTIAPGAVGPSKLGQVPAARAELSSASQTLANSASTPIEFDSERFDIGNLHDMIVSPSRLTAPIAGLYEIDGGIDWASNSVGERTTSLVVNRTTTIARQRDSADTTARDAQNVSSLYALSAGDYVELIGTQSSGGPLDAVNFPTTYLAMHWVAPGS